MEEGDDVGVEQQRGLALARAVGGRSGEVAEHAVHGGLVAAALQQVEDGSVPVLANARVQVQVEVPLSIARRLWSTRRDKINII